MLIGDGILYGIADTSGKKQEIIDRVYSQTGRTIQVHDATIQSITSYATYLTQLPTIIAGLSASLPRNKSVVCLFNPGESYINGLTPGSSTGTLSILSTGAVAQLRNVLGYLFKLGWNVDMSNPAAKGTPFYAGNIQTPAGDPGLGGLYYFNTLFNTTRRAVLRRKILQNSESASTVLSSGGCNPTVDFYALTTQNKNAFVSDGSALTTDFATVVRSYIADSAVVSQIKHAQPSIPVSDRASFDIGDIIIFSFGSSTKGGTNTSVNRYNDGYTGATLPGVPQQANMPRTLTTQATKFSSTYPLTQYSSTTAAAKRNLPTSIGLRQTRSFWGTNVSSISPTGTDNPLVKSNNQTESWFVGTNAGATVDNACLEIFNVPAGTYNLALSGYRHTTPDSAGTTIITIEEGTADATSKQYEARVNTNTATPPNCKFTISPSAAGIIRFNVRRQNEGTSTVDFAYLGSVALQLIAQA